MKIGCADVPRLWPVLFMNFLRIFRHGLFVFLLGVSCKIRGFGSAIATRAEKDKLVGNLWLAKWDGPENRALTFGNKGAAHPRWIYSL